MADSLPAKISPATLVRFFVWLVCFYSPFSSSFVEQLCAALCPLAGRCLVICVPLQLFFFSLPRRKPPLLVFSISLIPHPQWCVTAPELLPPSRGINHGAVRGCCSRSSTWRRSLPFPTELVPGRTNPTGNNPEQRGFTASL